jgi:hypothetical protein
MSTPTIDFRPYLSVTGVYDTGLAGVAVTNTGALADSSAYGVELSGGISGTHSWRHTKVGLDYSGSITHYSRKTFYDGGSQSLYLSVIHQLSRHTTLSLRETAGLFSRDSGFLGLPQTIAYDPLTANVPTTDFFDNRTVYASTQADLTFQKSARLSFDIGGDGFITRRRSSALYGVIGAVARGDVQYRLSRRSTIGANYMYTHFEFNHIFSSTDVHALNLTYAVRLTRDVEFTAYAGVARAENKFEQSVPLDPVIAALLGISSLPRVVHNTAWEPNVMARLSRTFHRGVVYASGSHLVTPGNGLFLTSYATTLGAGYGYTGFRRWSFNVGTDYTRSQSVGNIVGTYADLDGTISMSRQLARSVHILASFTARQYHSGNYENYNRVIYTGRIGLGFTPGNIPLRIW